MKGDGRGGAGRSGAEGNNVLFIDGRCIRVCLSARQAKSIEYKTDIEIN